MSVQLASVGAARVEAQAAGASDPARAGGRPRARLLDPVRTGMRADGAAMSPRCRLRRRSVPPPSDSTCWLARRSRTDPALRRGRGLSPRLVEAGRGGCAREDRPSGAAYASVYVSPVTGKV